MCFAMPVYAQFEDPNNFSFKTYTTEDGLPDNSVVKIITDPKGFLWIATRNGLSRFDGSEFTNYTLFAPKGNGLRSSWIADLKV
ncbi:MAG: two-component regulator propeller domain-containing protein, partial [Ferruginibacter sp.]